MAKKRVRKSGGDKAHTPRKGGGVGQKGDIDLELRKCRCCPLTFLAPVNSRIAYYPGHGNKRNTVWKRRIKALKEAVQWVFEQQGIPHGSSWTAEQGACFCVDLDAKKTKQLMSRLGYDYLSMSWRHEDEQLAGHRTVFQAT